jgi:alpha-tubulin suppressor-like RCC1 family protein
VAVPADNVHMATNTGNAHTIGLKSEGTVAAVGWNKHDQCDVNDWSNIVAVAAGWCNTIGLKSDGTVAAVVISCNLFTKLMISCIISLLCFLRNLL